ncbi:MAG: Monomeric sarcosine oxidase [Candidatus Celerinatantimonas neptuna]|nr:MAG: Monomeric sarcosine oxidase [Candidatus Celerinatantimonas neptuna]
MNSQSASKYDVIVVGGGFMGASSAFFLAKRGMRVLLLERNRVGQYASGVNFGNVRRQGRHLRQLDLANRSRRLWEQLPELIDDDLEFLPSGHMRICYHDSQIEALEAYARAPEAEELDLQILSGKTLRQRFPYLGSEVVAGSYAPYDGHANPRLAAPAFARAAKRQGAIIREGVEVKLIEKTTSGFHLCSTTGETFACEQLLISAGAWGSQLSNQMGEPVPIYTRGPQMSVTEPLPYRFKTVIGVYSSIEEEILYFRQIPRGNIIIGGCHRSLPDMEKRTVRFEPKALIYQMQQLYRVVPAISNINIIRSWSGIESYLPDSLPIMGPSSTTDGLFYAFAFCGHGFQLGPAVGDVMAELIATGATSTDIGLFDIKRFTQQFRPKSA